MNAHVPQQVAKHRYTLDGPVIAVYIVTITNVTATNKNSICAIYCRVSTRKQEEKFSVPTQKQILW